ncbi:MAG: alpha/beta fold hydrolase [Microthrixaceae bacterium]
MSIPPTRSGTHVVDGLSVTRRTPDPHPGTTVVLVHGAMDRAASFGRVMRRLDDLDVVAYDRRGYAGSLVDASEPGSELSVDQPAPWTLEDHATDVLSVTRWATSTPDGRSTPVTRVVVIGHSLGGLITLLAAHTGLTSEGDSGAEDVSAAQGRHPDTAPARIGAVGAYEAPTPWLEAEYTTAGALALDVGNSEGPAAAAEFFFRSMVGERAWERLPEATRELRRCEGPALMADLTAARAGPRIEGPDAIPLPAAGTALAVARGENGPPHLRRAAERLAAEAEVDCEVLEGAGHGAHLSHPDLFAGWVRRVAVRDQGLQRNR